MEKEQLARYLVIGVAGATVVTIAIIAAGMIQISGWGKMRPDLAERFFLDEHPECTIVEYKRSGYSNGVTSYVFRYRKPDEAGLYEETGSFRWGDGVWYDDWTLAKRVE